MKPSMQMLKAMNDLGDDVVEQAEHLRFGAPLWQKMLPIAALLLLLIGMGKLLPLQTPAVPREPAVSAEIPVQNEPQPAEQHTQTQPKQPEWIWQPEVPVCYTLPLADGGYVAVKPDGTVLLKVDRGTLSLLTDDASGEALAICHVVHPEDPDREKSTLTVYDLQGTLLHEINAWSIQVLDELALVNEEYEQHTLYRRDWDHVWKQKANYGSSAIAGNAVIVRTNDGSDKTLLLDRNGYEIASVGQGMDAYYCLSWNGRAYFKVYNQYNQGGYYQTRNHGLMDDRGNWVVEPYYEWITGLGNGYVSCLNGSLNSLVDVDTGQIVAEIQTDQGEVVAAYENLVLLSLDDDPSNAERAYSWSGQQIVGQADRIYVVDDEGDRVAELLQVVSGNTTSWLLPDGSLVRSVDCPAQAVSSRTAVLLGERIGLLDLQTGQAVSMPDRGYAEAAALWPSSGEGDYATGLFFASYFDENGVVHTDLLREDGTLVLENYAQTYDNRNGIARSRIGEKYGVFRVEGGYRHIDGTWVYTEG